LPRVDVGTTGERRGQVPMPPAAPTSTFWKALQDEDDDLGAVYR
jgi:hypothetical protein